MFSSKSARILAFLVFFPGTLCPAISQEPVVPHSAGEPAEALSPYDKMLERLQETENRLQQLEYERSLEQERHEEAVGHETRWPYLSNLLLVYDPEVGVAREQFLADVQARQPVDTPFEPTEPGKLPPKPKEKKWYDRYSVRGYTQFRLNETVWQEPGSADPTHQGDRSVGAFQNFFIRRARLILQGYVTDNVYIYFQEDFAVTPPGSPDATFFSQIRDWYADIFLDDAQINRLRVGQSKVPYGWENMQSSSNRAPLDRNDGFNSAVRNERDLGVFYYWTPVYAQKTFRYVLTEGLKGSNNYGVFAFGVYNGQGGSFVEQNNNLHIVSRLTWPFTFENGQILELSTQAYTGRYTVLSSPIRALGRGASIRPANTLETGNRKGIRDERVGWTAIWYPQPIGLQAEWNVGTGPGLNPAQTAVVERALQGGYVMLIGKYDTSLYGSWYPFVRWQHFKGGYKPERNAPYSFIEETEIGVEWDITPATELTVQYSIDNRTNTTAVDRVGAVPYRQFVGDLLRFQFQVNY